MVMVEREGRIGRAFEFLASLGLRWPRSVVAALVLLTALAIAELRTFALEPDVSRMLPDRAEVRLFRQLEARNAGGRSLLIAVHGTEVGALDATLTQLATALRTSSYLERVDATRDELLGGAVQAQMTAPLWLLDDEARDAVRARLTTERRASLAAMLEDLASDPLGGAHLATADPLGLRTILADAGQQAMPLPLVQGSNHVILTRSSDGSGAAGIGVIRVVGKREPYDAEFARALLADIAPRLRDVPHDLWGGYVVAREQATRMQSDMLWSSITSSLAIGLYLAWALKNLWAMPAVLAPTVLAVVWALPLGSALFGPFNVVAVGAAAVLVGLGVDFAIHLLTRYGDERQHADHEAAARAAARAVGLPVLLGTLTTCGAFASLALGEFQGLTGFGLLLALGLVLAALLTFVVSPLLARRRHVTQAPQSGAARALEAVANGPAGAAVAGLLLLLGAAGFCLAVCAGLRFDVDADALSSKTSASSAMRERVESLLGFSPLPNTILLPADYPAARLRAGLDTLRAGGVIAFADSPHRHLPDPARARAIASFRHDTADWVTGALADLEELGAQAAEFRPGLAHWQALLRADPGPLPARYVVDTEGANKVAVFGYPRQALRSEAAWHEFRAAVRAALGPEVEPFTSFALLGEVRRILVHDLRTCALATAVLLTACALCMARGHRLAWLALVPVLVGTGITVGVLVVFDIPLNLANFVAVPFLIGVGVDYGIHLANHLRAHPPVPGARIALGATGVAIWHTGATTALGFGSLMTSSMQGLWSLGLIAFVGVLACLLASVLIVVPAARWFAPRR